MPSFRERLRRPSPKATTAANNQSYVNHLVALGTGNDFTSPFRVEKARTRESQLREALGRVEPQGPEEWERRRAELEPMWSATQQAIDKIDEQKRLHPTSLAEADPTARERLEEHRATLLGHITKARSNSPTYLAQGRGQTLGDAQFGEYGWTGPSPRRWPRRWWPRR